MSNNELAAETLRIVSTVWTPESIGVAAFGGFLFGLLAVAPFFARVLVGSSLTAWDISSSVAGFLIFAGAVFYAGQVFVDVREDVADRLISRYSIWILFSVSMGLGTLLRLVVVERRHREKIAATAQAELDEELAA